MRSDGPRQRLLYQRRAVVANRPSWSPDGSRIRFGVSSDDEHGGWDAGSIVVIGRGGGRLGYVTDGRREADENAEPGTWAEDRGPDCSPDGRRIAFTHLVWLCPRCDQDEIYSSNVDGSDVLAMVADGWVSWSPSWSPDGRFFVANTDAGLAVFTAAGSLTRKLLRLGSTAAWQPLAG
jgi:Tol biopolymer transport system component